MSTGTAGGAPARADRYDVAVAALAPRPGDRILEIGCGPGMLVDRLCGVMAGTGEVIAIDRSATVIEAAARRNIRWVEAGVATFRIGAVEEVEFEAGSLDAVVAVGVRPLWADGGVLLERAAGWLRPGGAVHLVVDDPGAERLEQEAGAASMALVGAGLVDVQRTLSAPGIVVASGRRG